MKLDADTLEELYRRHYTAAYSYCIALCGQEPLAQDLVADAFVKAYLSLPSNIPSFRFWLLRVCRNLWIDQLRKETHLAGSEPLEYISDPETPENRYICQEERRALWRCLSALSPQDRELVTLHYFSGLPLQEIAPIIGKSYAAVRQRMVRLRHTLKLQMEEQGYGRT